MAAADPCLLLELPPELRNHIYEFVLVSPDEALIMKNSSSPALLRTCRQIREEASSLYYGQNIFLITNAESLCIQWLASVPAKMRAHIKTMRLYTNCRSSGHEAARYKRRLLTSLYSTISRMSSATEISLEVFLKLDNAMKPVWTARSYELHYNYCKRSRCPSSCYMRVQLLTPHRMTYLDPIACALGAVRILSCWNDLFCFPNGLGA